MLKRKLRSGYTTGACAAAAAKAAALLLFSEEANSAEEEVEIPFPDGSRVSFTIQSSNIITRGSERIARASVIKDAGDDPDVTNGAEIVAEVRLIKRQDKEENAPALLIKGGRGVGTITKPGLPVPIGEPAINPVPRKMIREAVGEVVKLDPGPLTLDPVFLEVTISVPNGEALAKKTLNHRLGIVGGISILGTTGIVRPLSSEAWTATITSSMDVAKASGLERIVLSAGRASEKAHMKKYGLPEEAYVMMGDYLEFSLHEAVRHSFTRIDLSAQWAKMLKIAMATPQTHVRHGAIDIERAKGFVAGLAGGESVKRSVFNTAREMFDMLVASQEIDHHAFFEAVCREAKAYAETITGGVPVTPHLVSYEGEVIASV